jgi:hypothetical protein
MDRLQILLVLFGMDNKRSRWKIEYEYSVYKIYDWDKKLAGYFFPQYSSLQHPRTSSKQPQEQEEEEDKIIERMNKIHEKVRGGNLMVPMLKLNLLDNTEGIGLDYTIEALNVNLQRAKTWKEWLEVNHTEFGISGAVIYTAREDRNMLSIVLGINLEMTLGEKELEIDLTPLLDMLHTDGML